VEGLENRQVPTVTYFGGNLLPHVEAQAVYLGNTWSSSPANTAQAATLDSFLKDVTGGAYMDALTRAGYGVGRGTATAGAVDNTALSPGSTISDGAIRARLQNDISTGLAQAPDPNRLYVVYVEPNVAVSLPGGQGTTQQGILGYHTAFAGHDAAGNPVAIRYAVVAYPGGTVGNSSLGTSAPDQLTAVTSHELAEAVTDPDVNFGRLGWVDPALGDEIGDITANNPQAFVRLDGFLVQEVADQNDQLLSIFPPSGTVATTTTLHGTVVHNNFNIPDVRFTVTIAPGSGTLPPGGTVELELGGGVVATAQVQVVNGVATASFDVLFFAPGQYTFSAQYLGNSQFQGSVSNSVTVTVR
jgi:hypothetical protein